MSESMWAGDTPTLVQLTEHLYVHRDAVNVSVVRRGDRALLIDCGDGSVASDLGFLGVTVDAVLFTHYHREQASGFGRLLNLLAEDAQILVSEGEYSYFAQPERYWQDPEWQWHLYSARPHHQMLTDALPVTGICRAGESVEWWSLTIEVLETPGHTDGSLSYVLEVDGLTVACSGDVIYGDGQLWDVYSLQKGGRFGDVELRDYHGFMGDRKRLAKGLETLRARNPDLLVPAHGEVIRSPNKSIGRLRSRLDAAYRNYARVSALRYYFPEVFAEFDDRSDFMPIRKGKPLPPFLTHLSTTWVLRSETGAALVMDCGVGRVLSALQEMLRTGEIKSVEALWISHYHDDHVDAVPQFQQLFSCPTLADSTVASVIAEPDAFLLPCLSPAVVRVDRSLAHGKQWRWHEYTLTAFHFPGQTFYHGALLVEGHGLRLFFIGDSFTPAGLDDYCAGNRNLLGGGQGLDACLQLVAELKPDYLFNCHVDEAFWFTEDEIETMRTNLKEREELFGSLLPWDHPNYGLDEHWVRVHPYHQSGKAGTDVRLAAVITNHSPVQRVARCRAVPPPGWGAPPARDVSIPRGSVGRVEFEIAVPAAAHPGRYPVPFDITYGRRRLGLFRTAVVTVE